MLSRNLDQVLRGNRLALEKARSTRLRAQEICEDTEKNRLVLESKRMHPYHGFVEVHVASGDPFLMFCNNDDPVALYYFWLGADAWEPTSLKLWSMLCEKEKGAVLDIGAFSGLYSLIANSRGRSNIVAFEPSRMPLSRLIDNVNVNAASCVHIVPKAASNYEAITSFTLKRDLRTLSTAGQLSDDTGGSIQESVYVGSIDVELEKLNIESVSHAKIDVEGAEVSALKGMMSTIETSKPDLLIEIKPELVDQVSEMLEVFGYSGYSINEEKCEFIPIIRTERKLKNYFFSANHEKQLSIIESVCS